MPDADLVLEGGGMKGIGVGGAVGALMRAGYEFPRVAGTSAGAIVGALVAAGIGEPELVGAMARLKYARVPDRGLPRIPVLSEAISLLHSGGAYEGDYIHDFVRDELERLGVRTFGDLRRVDPGADANLLPERSYSLVVMATDVTNGRLLRLPWDYDVLGLDPDEQLVADAVLGVKVVPGLPAGNPELFPGIALPALPPVKLLEQVVATAVVGNDQTYLERPCVRRRTISVDTSAVGIVEFDASPQQRAAVIANGIVAAETFLETWDWDAFRRDCRPLPSAR